VTGGEAHDIKGFAPLMRMIADRIEALLADKGYDADAIREELAQAEIEAVIPAKRNPQEPRAARHREIQVAQSDRAPLQQAQELAPRRHPLRQDRPVLPRLRRHRRSQALATLCPRSLGNLVPRLAHLCASTSPFHAALLFAGRMSRY
jgi:transposase